MPTFNDSDNLPQLVPEGDYVLCVYEFLIGMQTKGKTCGAEKYDVTFDIDGGGRCYETLIDHQLTAWKIDCFLKSAGIRLPKGQPFTFAEHEAREKGIPWVDPIGLVVTARLIVEEYTTQAGVKKQKNKIAVFYTDRAKHQRRAVERPASETAYEDKPF